MASPEFLWTVRSRHPAWFGLIQLATSPPIPQVPYEVRAIRVILDCNPCDSTSDFAGVRSPPPACYRWSPLRCSYPTGDTSDRSSFVPLACPSECETARNNALQRRRKYAQIPCSELGFLAFSIGQPTVGHRPRSDLKSVRSADRCRARPPENPSSRTTSTSSRF